MTIIENDCVGCGNYCGNCGAKHTEHFYCDKCGEEDTLYYLGDRELCLDCIEKIVRKEKEEDGVCDQCGVECTVYSSYGLCEDCIFDSLEVVEGSYE